MPIKKTEENTFNIQKLMQSSDSYKSLIYGIVTVVVLFVVIALGINTLSKNKAVIDDHAAVTENKENVETDNRYTVLEGETLWSIAQKQYNDGFKWIEIAKVNNISNPASLTKGDRLIIPTVTPRVMAQVVVSPTPSVAVAPTSAVTPTSVITPTVVAVVSPAPVKSVMPTGTMTAGKITGTTYTVVRGDNLWNIAVRAYGDGYKWVEIARVNNLANPHIIHQGNVLKLSR